jgi:hypothetical protein
MTTLSGGRLASITVLVSLVLMGACAPEPVPTVYDFSCRKVTETSGASSWIFEGKHRPPLRLDGGAGFLGSVNKALEAANLPGVAEVVPERESITGSRGDRTKYQWEEYPGGRLTVARSLCSDARYRNYDCIWKITLEEQDERR